MLKKTFVVLAAVLMFFSIWYINVKPELQDFGNTYETYIGGNSSLAKIQKSGSYGLNFLTAGESVRVDSVLDLGTILNALDADLVFSEKCSEGVNYYAYTSKLKHKKLINGKLVNLQVFVSEEQTVIGTPLIFGSF